MTESQQPDSDRRTGTQAVIDKMLTERQEMLVLFSKVAGLEPFAGHRASVDDLREFSQILVDYIATAHFGIYERIAEGKERRQRVLDVAASIYAQVQVVTDEVIGFNDRYESAAGPGLPPSLTSDLSRLGEHLATRIELEDRLLAAMLPGASE
ncbi:MAG: Rsd/AlgQ family anti-sigma factor [Pseudomonadota bacterium]